MKSGLQSSNPFSLCRIAAILLFLLIFILLLNSADVFGFSLSGSAKSTKTLPGFRQSRYFDEQERTFRYRENIRIYINAPSVEKFNPRRPTAVVLFALPNGNSIEQTAGKVMRKGDDWHYDIQHIAAQMRFLRNRIKDYNLVVIYLENDRRSWSWWKRETDDYSEIIVALADTLKNMFRDYQPYLVLSGHSGGGAFVNGFIEALDSIPADVRRIVFLDSNYGYDHEIGAKLADWVKRAPDHFLSVLAYNDSIALYNGKPFISDTGGTWYRSKLMVRDLAPLFQFEKVEDSSVIRFNALDHRIQVLLKKNPKRAILHTVQVERNGFIHTMLTGTPLEEKDYEYYGEHVYSEFISGMVPAFTELNIPARPRRGIGGAEFMRRIESLPFPEREEAIFAEISRGNIPDFLRQMIVIEDVCADTAGKSHTVRYEVMPDYLAVGSDEDFCRIPMGPVTAQRLADLFGATMPTRSMVDAVYASATVKLEPVTYHPVGHANETIAKFFEHNQAIEKQRIETGESLGELVAGIKKDIVISKLIDDPQRPDHVIIYGWHRPDGKAIQPLTNVHVNWYVDYSHGVRLVNSEVFIDGLPIQIENVLKNPLLYRLLSDEDTPMSTTRYGNTLHK